MRATSLFIIQGRVSVLRWIDENTCEVETTYPVLSTEAEVAQEEQGGPGAAADTTAESEGAHRVSASTPAATRRAAHRQVRGKGIVTCRRVNMIGRVACYNGGDLHGLL